MTRDAVQSPKKTITLQGPNGMRVVFSHPYVLLDDGFPNTVYGRVGIVRSDGREIPIKLRLGEGVDASGADARNQRSDGTDPRKGWSLYLWSSTANYIYLESAHSFPTAPYQKWDTKNTYGLVYDTGTGESIPFGNSTNTLSFGNFVMWSPDKGDIAIIRSEGTDKIEVGRYAERPRPLIEH